VLDARGEVLGGAGGWLVPALAERELREVDPALLADALASGAAGLAARTVAPGERVAVQAVLAGLPPEALRFRIESAPAPAPAAEPAPPPAAAPADDAAEPQPDGAFAAPDEAAAPGPTPP
jgi:hypothetical protein